MVQLSYADITTNESYTLSARWVGDCNSGSAL